LHRFPWKRKRVALAALPATAMLVMAGIAAASGPIQTTSEMEPEAGAASGPTRITLKATRHVMAHRAVTFRGHVSPASSRRVVVQVGGRRVRAYSNDHGAFKARWRAPRAGVYRARAAVADSPVRSHRVQVNAYRPAAASYYGPGLYGGGLACGGTLRPGTIGVANKSLPCGTHLTLRYGHRTVRVQVIDRGPYAGNREFDLTAATKARLGFPSTGTVLSTR